MRREHPPSIHADDPSKEQLTTSYKTQYRLESDTSNANFL